MANGNRRSVLIVGGDAEALNLNVRELERREYRVTPINYLETREIPQGEFDFAVVSDLGEFGIEVLKNIPIKKKFLYTANNELTAMAREAECDVYSPVAGLGCILEGLQ